MKDVLSEEELVARLNQWIDRELDRPEGEYDPDLIEECTMFLAELLPGQKASRRSDLLGKILRMMRASE